MSPGPDRAGTSTRYSENHRKEPILNRRKIQRMLVLAALIVPLGLLAPPQAETSWCADQNDWCEYCISNGCFYFLYDNCSYCTSGGFCCGKSDYQKSGAPDGCE